MKRGSRGRDDNRMLIGGIVVIVVLFYAAYTYGLRSSASVSQSKVNDLRRQQMKLKEQEQECQNKVRERDLNTADELKLSDQINLVQSEIHQIEQESQDMLEQTTECRNELDALDHQKAEDAKISDDTVMQATDELSAEIARNSGNSSKVILLYETLRMLLVDHEALRKRVDPTGRLPNIKSKAYQMEVVNRWANIDKELRDDKDVDKTLSTSERIFNKFLKGQEGERWAKFRNQPHRLHAYDVDKSGTSILWLEKTAGGWPKPQWKGVTSNRKKEGVINTQIVPVAKVHMQIRKMYNMLTCSASLNVTAFMFPNTFRTCEACKPELLSNYVDTPVVAFCTNCGSVDGTDEFDYLCEGNKANDQYGTELFWRVRSRLKYKDTTLDDAQQYIEKTLFSMVDKKQLRSMYDEEDDFSSDPPPYLLGVVIPAPPTDDSQRSMKPTVLYTKVLKEVGVPQLAGDEEYQRNPPLNVVAEAVSKRVTQLKASPMTKNVKVYLSAQHFSYDDWEAVMREPLFAKLDKQGILFYTRGAEYSTTVDLKDTMITAWCDEIIIGRYDQKSLQVGENYLLTNRLNSTGISVW